MQTEGKPCTKFVVPSAVLLRGEVGCRVKRRNWMNARAMFEAERAGRTDGVYAESGFVGEVGPRAGGIRLLEGSEAIRASGATDEKKNSVDLVTEYDVRVEELVKRELSAEYPAFKL